MSNLLLDKLPTTDRLGNRIRTDFRAWIDFETIVQDPKYLIDEQDTMNRCVDIIYKDKPLNIRVAFDELQAFNSMYKEYDGQFVPQKECIFDWKYDALNVYSAFMKTYHIDLMECGYIHWWKFRALFIDLSGETYLAEAMKYRSKDVGSEKDIKERNRLIKMKEKYAIK